VWHVWTRARGYDPSMDLTPELLRTVEFNDAKKGGYDHDEVDEFLDRAAADLARQHEQIRESEGRIAAAERRAQEAEAQAKDHSDSDETLRRTLVLAQRTADAAVKEAHDDAARIIAEARQKADGMIASAEEQVRREVGATRDRLQAEIRELEARRADLHGRITDLSGHLDTERSRIGRQLDELRASLGSDSMAMASVATDEPSLFDPDGDDATSADEPEAVAAEPGPAEPASDVVDLTPGAAQVDDADASSEDLSELPPPPEDWSPATQTDQTPADETSEASDGVEDGGPPTEATPVVDLGSDVGSSHLDELRRAVSDGPDSTEDDDAAMAAFFDQDDDDAEPSRRFGRRR
jgi:cell division initiation protein